MKNTNNTPRFSLFAFLYFLGVSLIFTNLAGISQIAWVVLAKYFILVSIVGSVIFLATVIYLTVLKTIEKMKED